MTATEELIADMKLWSCSPRVPLKAQLVMLEAIGRLSSPPEATAIWTLSSERLPEGDGSVLASGPNITSEGGTWVNIISAGYLRRNQAFVTHWMPLPPTPQDGRS
jgi:hypothetical protein